MVFQTLAGWLLQADKVLVDLWPLLKSVSWTVLAVLAVLALLRLQDSAKDRPVRYSVPLPKVQEAKDGSNKKTYLDEPSIKIPGSSAIQCYAPATGQLLGLVNPSSPAAIDRAVAAAKAAQKTWASTTTLRDRRRVLSSLLQHVLEHQQDICRVACLDSGKLMLDAALGEVLVVAERLQWTIKHGEEALRPSWRPTNPLLMPHKRNSVVYDQPLGVVAALVSWNYPFHNLLAPIVSALFSGNAIVVKVSEQTAWSAQYFTALARGALVAHGYDPAIVQTVVCWPSVASHLTRHPDIAHITFIGSQAVARHVATDAAAALTPVCAELGGKDPFIVLDSVGSRLPAVTETLLRGTFQSSGQNCIGIERVIATPGVYEKLLESVTERVKALRVGTNQDDDTEGSAKEEYDMGAMVSDAHFDRLEVLVQEAVGKGARLLAGGKRYAHPRFPRGHYFLPTLLADVTPDMSIAQEECFGPILVIMRAASTKPADVLAVANTPNFGLGASVFGSEGPELSEIVNGLEAGMVAVNDFAAYYAVQLPFGGVGGSGYGRFAGREGLQSLVNAKSVCADRLGWLGVRTSLPPIVRYPVRSQARGWAFVRGLVDFGYGQTLGKKAKGLVDVVKNM